MSQHDHAYRPVAPIVPTSSGMPCHRYVPFKAVCLPQAMAARIMLGRRGVASVLHFGAAKGKDRPIDAHAWLDAAGVEVTGYPVAAQFAEVACFV